jgi:hypothetical protein
MTMSTMRGAAIAAIMAVISTQVSAQANRTLARYRVSSDTLRYEIKSPFAIAWIRGADTVRGPAGSDWHLESHAWRGTVNRLEVVIRSDQLERAAAPSVDTFTIRPDGIVSLKNGAPPSADTWLDVFPFLPEAAVHAGFAWKHTVVSGDTISPGAQLYRNVREYLIERVVDTLGTRLLEIAARGRVHLRLAVDSTSWIEADGPMTECTLFDLPRGRLIRRASSMILSGRGVPTASVDTVPARFQSTTLMELTEPARAGLLLKRVQRVPVTEFKLGGNAIHRRH